MSHSIIGNGPVQINKNTRFLLVDALRGIAALAVVIFHCNAAIVRSATDWVPNFLQVIFSNGYLGVDIFFVISGFVISFSVRSGDYTFSYLKRFAFRRSIRLDPPYWITLALELLAIKVSLELFPEIKESFPSALKLVTHLFYMQDLSGVGNIIPIFWTLCYEIQFYIFMIILLMLHQYCSSRISLRMLRILSYFVLGSLFCISLLDRFNIVNIDIQGLFINRWFQFSLGMFLWFMASGKISWKPVIFAGSVVVSFVLIGLADPQQLVAVATFVLLFIAIKRDSLTKWLRNPFFQFLGKISYSLYLIHGVIAWRLIGLFQRVFDVSGSLMAILVVLLAIGTSVLAATILWWLVERPSMNFSKKIKLPRNQIEIV